MFTGAHSHCSSNHCYVGDGMCFEFDLDVRDACLALYAIGACVEWWRLARDREPGGCW